MALQIFEARRLRFGNELRIHVEVAGDERHVHDRTVFLHDRTLEELAVVEEVVKDRRFFTVSPLHLLETAHVEEPLEDLAADVDAVARRRIVHGAVLGIGRELAHRRREGHHVLGHHVVTDDADHDARRTDVLLCAGIKICIFLHVDRLGQEAGRQVGDEVLSLRVRQIPVFRAVDRIVLADVNVICILADWKVRNVRDVGERLILGGRDLIGRAVLLRFLVRSLRPLAGHDVIRDAVLHEVHRQHRELQMRAALHEHDFIILGNGKQRPKVRLRLVNDRLIRLGPVRHLHHGHARSAVIQHFRLCFFQHFLGQNRRTG